MAEAQETAASTMETTSTSVNKAVEDALAMLKRKKKVKGKKKSAKAGSAAASKEGRASAKTTGYKYGEMLDRIYLQLQRMNPELLNMKKATLKPPIVERVGTTKILWTNFQEICAIMKRDMQHVMSFCLAELHTTGSIDAQNRLLLRGKYTSKTIESLLKKYIKSYVYCEMCRGVHTRLEREQVSRMSFKICNTCGASSSVANIQKGFHAAQRGERRAARRAA